MIVIPVNNWIHIDLPETKNQEDSLVLLPEDYRKTESPYKVVQVLTNSEGITPGTLIIVPTHTIQEVDVQGETVYLVLKNHVMAEVQL